MSRSKSLRLRAIPVLALVAPFVILGLIYVLGIQPREASEQNARAQAAVLGDELARVRSSITNAPRFEPLAQREFEARTTGSRAPEMREAIRRLLNGPAVGGVENLSMEIGGLVQPDGAEGPALDPRLALFRTPVAYTPLTLSFEASYAQIGRFLWTLRELPSTFELRAMEIAPAGRLMRAKLVLFVFQRPGVEPIEPIVPDALEAVDVELAPTWGRDPFAGRVAAPARAVAAVTPAGRDPVVQTILYSSQNRAAVVDGRVVRVGDRLGPGVVHSIERDGVTLVMETGQTKRLVLEPRALRAAKR